MLLFVFTAICSGVIAGAFGALRAEQTQIAQIQEMDNNHIIMSSFLGNIKFLIWILLWGLNGVGIPVIVYLLYQKGAYISAAVYSVLAFENVNKFMAVISMIPFVVCTVLSVTFLAHASIENSFSVFCGTILKKNYPNGKGNILKLFLMFLLSGIFALLGGITETLVKVNIT